MPVFLPRPGWFFCVLLLLLTSACGGKLVTRTVVENREGVNCSDPPHYGLKRLIPESGALLPNSPVLWEIKASGGCVAKYRVWLNDDDPRDFTESYTFIKTHALGQTVQSLRVATLNSLGEPVIEERVESDPFTVSSAAAASQLVCRVQLSTSVVEVAVASGATTFSPAALVTAQVQAERGGTPVGSRIMSVTQASLAPELGTLPSVVRNEHGISFRPSALGIYSIIVQLQEDGGIAETAFCAVAFEVRAQNVVAKPVVTLTLGGVSGVLQLSAPAPKTLAWNATNATTCTSSPEALSGMSGSKTVTPGNGTTVYTYTCTNAGGSTSATVTAQVGTNLIFVTSGQWTGSLGGIGGADSKCAAAASAANLGGSWKALISNSTTHAKDRIGAFTTALYKVNGEKVANSAADLWDNSVLSRVDVFENGVRNTGNPLVWTGTDWMGTRNMGLSNKPFCGNWAATDSGVQTGRTDRSDLGWVAIYDIGTSPSNACSNLGRLYCFRSP
jgi:hypothetical protein